jgi:hypothetical protein
MPACQGPDSSRPALCMAGGADSLSVLMRGIHNEIIESSLGEHMRRIITLTVILGLIGAACSSDDTESTATTAAPTTTETAATSTTLATTTTEAEPEIPTAPVVPGEDADADAIVALYATVFDSTSTFEEKAPLIDDPTGLEAAIEGYRAAGDSVGGIFLEVSQTGVLGDRASVLYDLLFGERPFQSDQLGDAVRIDEKWVVSRDFFCSIVELARVPCP